MDLHTTCPEKPGWRARGKVFDQVPPTAPSPIAALRVPVAPTSIQSPPLPRSSGLVSISHLCPSYPQQTDSFFVFFGANLIFRMILAQKSCCTSNNFLLCQQQKNQRPGGRSSTRPSRALLLQLSIRSVSTDCTRVRKAAQQYNFCTRIWQQGVTDTGKTDLPTSVTQLPCKDGAIHAYDAEEDFAMIYVADLFGHVIRSSWGLVSPCTRICPCSPDGVHPCHRQNVK